MAELVKPKSSRKKTKNLKHEVNLSANSNYQDDNKENSVTLEEPISNIINDSPGDSGVEAKPEIVDPMPLNDIEISAPSLELTENYEQLNTVEGNILEYPYTLQAPFSEVHQDVIACLENIEAPTAPPLATPESDIVSYCYEPVSIRREVPEIEGPFLKDLLDSIDVSQEVSQLSKPMPEDELEKYYSKAQITGASQFVSSFIHNTKPEKDELFLLLTQYEEKRKQLDLIKTNLNDVRSSMEGIKMELWSFNPNVTLTERAKCKDNNDVLLSFSYSHAEQNVVACDRLKDLVNENLRLMKEKASISASALYVKEKIVYMLGTLQQSGLNLLCRRDGNSQNTLDAFAISCLNKLSSAVGTLFNFLRTWSHQSDKDLFDELKNWLAGTIVPLVRAGTWKDQVYVLCHILRLPSSVATWAAPFVQCPPHDEDLAVALLSVLLSPVYGIEAFLADSNEDETWTLLDPEDEINEAVLSSIYAQIPIKAVIKKYVFTNSGTISEEKILKSIAFFSCVVKVIDNGLRTYTGSDFKNFSKQLGLLTRELVQLLSGQIDIYKNSPGRCISTRLQVEYDAFVARCCKALLQNPSSWQFLAAISFSGTTSSARWRLLLDFIRVDKLVVNPAEFAPTFAKLCVIERYHILSALCNLALEPGSSSKKLTRTVVLHIFNIGFLNSDTRESCAKDAKSLISALADTNGFLISEFIDVYDIHLTSADFDENANSLEFWQALNLHRWTPASNDISVLIRWLEKPHYSIQNNIGRYIFRQLDYRSISAEDQLKIGRVLALECHQANSDSLFSQFLWAQLCRLRLHSADVGYPFTSVPELEKDAKLGLLVSQQISSAVYFALQTTDLGHSVPLINANGFKLVRLLYNGSHYEAAYSCIDCIATLFLECPDSFSSCDDLISLLGDIAAQGDSYFTAAKSLVTEEPSPAFSKFAGMLHSHLKRFGTSIRLNIATKMWLGAFTKLPLWHYSSAVIQLIEIVCNHSFCDLLSWKGLLNALEETLSTPSAPTPRSPLASFLGFAGSPSPPTILSKNFNALAPWFTFAAIEVEFEVFEVKPGLWNTLLFFLWENRSKKTSIDGSLKKVCNHLKLAVRTSKQLAFYRWAALALELPISHPLNILVFSKLMGLYVCRVPGVVDRGGVGTFFFHGIVNSSLLGKLKEKLKLLSSTESSLSETYKTILLWLESSNLMAPNFLVATLPSHYNAPLLHALLTKQVEPWLSLLPEERIKGTLSMKANEWKMVLGRDRKVVNSPKRAAPENPLKRIETILSSGTGDGQSIPEPYLLEVDEEFKNLFNQTFFINSSVKKIKLYLVERTKLLQKFSVYQDKVLSLPCQFYKGKHEEKVVVGSCEPQRKKGIVYLCRGSAKITFKVISWEEDKEAKNEFTTALNQVKTYSLDISPEVVSALVKFDFASNDKSCEQSAKVKFFDILFQLWQQAHATCSFTTEILQSCIIKVQNEWFIKYPQVILQSIIKYRNATFLHHLFDPCEGDNIFLDLYQKASNHFSDSSLLQKFDVKRWLIFEKPKRQLTSNLINIIFRILESKEIQTNLPSQVILNEQLQHLVRYNFPEHFGEVLDHLFRGTNSYTVDTWYSFILAISPPDVSVTPGSSITSMCTFISHFSKQQSLLSLEVILHTIAMLSEKFVQLRSNGSLYSQYQQCAEPVICFMGCIAQSLTVRLLSEKDSSSVELVQSACVPTEAMFTPWLAPARDPSFTSDNARLAELTATLLASFWRFLGHNLSEYETISSRGLNFYLKHFCHENVDQFALSIIHSSFFSLPWDSLAPTLPELEAILSAVNTYIPLCHSFLGQIFIKIKWKDVVFRSLTVYSNEINYSFHVCLLHLLVKFPSEPSLKQNQALKTLIDDAKAYAWHLVDSSNYASVVAWYTGSCDPTVVLNYSKSDYFETDSKILRLLQVAAGYDLNVKHFHLSTPQKRQIFVAGIAKCMATAACKRVPSEAISKLVMVILDDIECIVSATVPELNRVGEAILLLGELLNLLSEVSIATPVGDTLIAWLTEKKGNLVVHALLQCCGRYIENPIFYGTIVEATIDNYFAHSGMPNWNRVVLLLDKCQTEQIEHVLVSNSCFLTLYAMLTVRCQQSNFTDVYYRLSQTFSTVKTTELSEPKILLLLGLALILTQKQPKEASVLESLMETAIQLSNDRSSGFLSAIGFKKNSSPSLKMKLCCLATAAGISNILRLQFQKPDENKAATILEKANVSKQFGSLQPSLIKVLNDLECVQNHQQLQRLLYSTAAQFYNKLYFSSIQI